MTFGVFVRICVFLIGLVHLIHMVEMSEATTRSGSWKGIIIKTLVVLLFPLAIRINDGTIAWWSLLLWVDLSQSFAFNETYSILTALVLIVPGILFYRHILISPISSSIRGRAVMTAIVLWAAPIAYSVFFGFFMIGSMLILPTVSISLFILLPILQRELVIRSTPMKMRNYDFQFLSRNFKHSFGKQRFLPILLWSGLLLSPFLFLNLYGDIQFISVFYEIFWRTFSLILESPMYGTLLFSVTNGSFLPLILLMSSLRFLFVRDIFRFKDGFINKTRLVSIALLGEITPVAILSVQYIQVIPSYFSYVPIVSPFPLFPLIGFLFVRLWKIFPVREIMWDKEEHRMWFEGDKPTQSPFPQPMEQGIKVPITYMIISHIRRLRKR